MIRRTVLLVCALAAFFAPHAAFATISNVDNANDVCPSTANPCIINQTIEVVDGAVLDFGIRTVQIQGSGLVDIKNGAATIRCGRMLVNVTGTAFSMVGPSVFGGTEGGLMIVEVSKRCSGNANLTCFKDSTCATQNAGVCTTGTADVSLDGKVIGNADTAGTFVLRAAGNVTIGKAIQMNGATTESDGGSIEIDSSGSITVNSDLSATAGGLSGGGEICLLADVDTTVNGVLNVTGGDFDGGIVEIEGKRDVVMVADVIVSSAAGGGFGGEISVDAGRDVRIVGGTSSNRQLLAADGHTSFDNFAGDGGTHEYFAGRDMNIGQFVRMTSDGAPPDGYGDFIFLTANNDVTVAGEIRSNPRGDQGGGGEIEVLAFGDATVTATGSIDVAGAGSGGGDATVSAEGQLDFNGTATAEASNSGTSGSLELDGGDQLFVRGSLVISGTKIRTFIGSVDISACRINMLAGSSIDNNAEGGITRFSARERATIASGATVRADGVGGINRITYRTPAKPPVIQGTVSPSPQLVVDSNLPGCPLCGNHELDGGETCEDGNRAGGDGCSADCQDEGCIATTPSPGYPTVPLCSDGDACTVDTCNTTSHTCHSISSCDDGVACTVDACQGTVCAHTPNDALCDDGNPCADGVCGATSGCTAVPRAGVCDDGLFCNGSDSCGGGTCSVHNGAPCDGGPECRNLCDEVRQSCIAPSGTPCTPDTNICTSDFCNSTGQCIHPLSNGSCDDGVFCNGDDVCSGGSCSIHIGNPCQALGECRDTCDEQSNACQTPAGAACTDDHNVCTVDQCNGAGGCLHGANATFTAQRFTFTRIGGASNDRFIIKGTFPLADLTTKPSDTGFRLDIVDANANVVYTATVPAAAIVDSDGTGKQYRYSDRTGAYPQANGLNSAILKADTRKSAFKLKMRMRDYDVPGVVGAPRVAVALLFGQTAGTDCVTDVSAPCTPRGSKVICGD